MSTHFYTITASTEDCPNFNPSDAKFTLGPNYALKGQLEMGTTEGFIHWQMDFYQRNGKSFEASQEWWNQLTGGHPNLREQKEKTHQHYVFQKYCWKDDTSLGARFIINPDTFPKFLSEPLEETKIQKKITVHKTRQIYIFFGPPCTGKSYQAREWCSKFSNGQEPFLMQAFNENAKQRWLGDYQGQDCCMIEEFNPKSFGKDYLKMLLDRQPQQIATLAGGKSALFSPGLIILTTNMTFDQVNKFIKDPIWSTRITKAYQFTTPVPEHLLGKKCTIEQWTPPAPGGPTLEESNSPRSFWKTLNRCHGKPAQDSAPQAVIPNTTKPVTAPEHQ
jgi:hypothetical protein